MSYKKIKLSLSCLFIFVSITHKLQAKVKPVDSLKTKSLSLMTRFSSKLKTKTQIMNLQKDVINKKGKSVPTLVKVMKSSKFPEKNRWIATFLLGRVMGVKAAPFISKFLDHPSWVMRMASLKTLLALKQYKYQQLFGVALQDKSLIVRTQALENIRRLKLIKQAPKVWAMLYNKKNYHINKDNKTKKRTNIIKNVLRTIGDLKFQEAKKPLLSMIQNKKYDDIFNEMNYALTMITSKKSPKGDKAIIKRFWKKTSMSTKNI